MIRVEKLGIVDYEQALARMRAHVHHRAHGHRDTPDELWLTEHPPVFTLGFASRPEHLHATGDIPVVETERGGQVTYHGPGQVIAYLLLDLRRRKIGVRELVCRIETGIIACLAGHGIEGLRKPGAPGIYVRPRTAPPPDAPLPGAPLPGAPLPGAPSPGAPSPGASPPDIPPEPGIAKIASIGLKVSHGLTWHGVALNGAMDLEPFDRIDPCGYAGLRMTDVAKEAGTHSHDLGRRLPDDLARALVEAIEG